MFNLKNIVNKITDRGRESQPNSPGRNQDEDACKDSAEGFLCPKCMKAFPSMEELQTHYISTHDGDSEGATADIPGVSPTSFLLLHQEVGEKYKQDVASLQGDLDNIEGITDAAELKALLLNALQNKASLKQEKEMLEQKAAQLARDNATLKAASDEADGNSAALKERLKVVEAQLAHRESIDDTSVLRQELIQVQRVMDELTREKEHERDQLRAELQELKSKCAAKEADKNEESDERVHVLMTASKIQDNAITELQVMVHALKDDLSTVELRLEEEKLKSFSYESELEEAYTYHSDLKNKFENLKKENLELVGQKESLNNALEVLQNKEKQDSKLLCDQICALKAKLEQTMETLRTKEKELRDAQIFADTLTQQKEILNGSLNHKAQLLEQSEREIARLESKLEGAVKDLDHVEGDVSRLESKQKELLEQIEAGEGPKAAIQQLTQEKAMMDEQLEIHTATLKDFTAKYEILKHQKYDLEKSHEKLSVKLSNLESEFQNEKMKTKNLTEDIASKEATLLDFQRQLDENKTDLSLMYNKVNTLENKAKKDEEQIEGYRKQVGDFEAGVNKSEALIDSLKSNISDKEQRLAKLIAEEENLKQHFENITCEHKQDIKNLKTQKESLEINLCEKEEQLKTCQADNKTLTINLSELRTRSEEEKKKVEDEFKKKLDKLGKEYNTSKTIIFEKEEAISFLCKEKTDLEEQVVIMKEDLEKEHMCRNEMETILKSQLETEKSAKATIEEALESQNVRCATLEGEFLKCKQKYDTNMEKKDEELKEIQILLDETEGSKLVLGALLESRNSEHQKLLERYYASTSEGENLHKSIAELRLKLEESQAALHELGRENQTLQLELEKVIGRKWIEDSDAKNCSLCHKEFTFILRKHHCRNCGKIFCNECSSKMAPIASNKKCVRVCDSCYNELCNK